MRLNLAESNIRPRSHAMTPSDQNYVLHLYPQSKCLCEGKPGVDVRDNPFAEMIPSESVLMLRGHRKG
jgi:hypothetical protein